MIRISRGVVVAGVTAVFAASAWAGTPIDETRPLDADGRVTVNNLAGRIEVTGWDRNEVSISGELGEDVEKLDVSGDARKLSVFVRYPRKQRGGVEETLLRLQVPAGAALDLEGVSADISVKETRGTVNAASVSGDVEVRAGAESVVLNSVSGDIRLEAPSRDAQLQSVSGDVTATGARGKVAAETVSGDVRLTGSELTSVSAQSVSGDVVLELGLVSDAKVQVETLSGEISTRLLQPPDAEISLKTFSGELRGEYGAAANGRREVSKTLGAGKGRIELNSFSGDIELGP